MNYLKKIELENFKSIREMELELDNLNVLIGANGAGKSNFVSFFKMLEAIIAGKLQKYVGLQGSSHDFFFYGNSEDGIKVRLHLEIDSAPVIYRFLLRENREEQLVFIEEKVEKNGEVYDLGSGYRESRLSQASGDVVTDHLCNEVTALLKQWQVFQFHETSRMQSTHYYHDNQRLFADGSNLAPYLLFIKERYPVNYRRIVRTIQQIMPYFGDFELEPLRLYQERNRLDWRESSTEMRFSACQFSDGSLRFAALSTLLLQPKELLPRLILIDEPELGLHPKAVRLLGAMLKAASDEAQLILATQSKTLVDEFGPEDVVVIEREVDDSTIHFSSTLRRLDGQLLEKWLHDYRMGDIWDKDIIGGRP